MASPDKRRMQRASRIAFPAMVCVGILIGIAAIGYLGYQKASASSFFVVKRVYVVGTERASGPAIEGIVRSDTDVSGAWHTDLAGIKAKIEKLPFVKTAAVTRVLPDGIRISVVERQPAAIVLKRGRGHLVDADGQTLSSADEYSEDLPFTMIGWDDSKSDRATKENIDRVKIYQKLVSEWRASNLATRVAAVDLTNIRDPRALISDSGSTVSISVGRENFSENLTRGIKAIVGKGNMFEGVNLVGTNLVLEPRKQ